VAAVLALFAAVPATGAPLERTRYSFTETGTEFICGVTYEFEVTVSGLFMLKRGHHGDPTPYFFDNSRFSDVHLDAGGNGFIIDGHTLYKDVKITKVAGTVYSFVAMYAGQPFTIRTLDGRVVLRDRGNLTIGFSVDTKGDDDLSNDEFLSFEVLRDAGAHPGFYLTEEEFCAAVDEAVAG
jgi:hypothetical protein